MLNNTALTMFLLSVGLFFAFSSSQFEQVKKLSHLTSDYKTAIQKVADIVEIRKVLMADYETIPPDEVERLNKVLPDGVNNVRMALDLDTAAGRYGISIKDIRMSTAPSSDASAVVLSDTSKPYDKVVISFSFISTHENFMRFLADLESNLRIMDVKSITFQTGTTNLYQYNVSVETYWLK